MKVTLPEQSGDITLYQYQKYVELLTRTDLDTYQFEQRKIQIFTGIKPNDYKNLLQKDIFEMLEQIEIALNSVAEFKSTFTMEGIEFGFIPNLDKITGAEYFDLSKYGTQPDTLHNLMAVLFRPIDKKDKLGNYSVVEYNGTSEWAEAMKLTPMNIVNGALFFFLNLSTELVNYTQKYMDKEMEQVREQKQKTTLQSGDGMQVLTN